MYVISCEGINTLLFEACKLLILHGIPRQIGTDTCCEYPEPVCFKMKNPHARWVIIPQRKWNIFLAYAESLWIAAGRNDLSFIGCYLNRMVNFSDDGLTLRGGYGPRIRAYDGTFNDYLAYGLAPSISNVNSGSVDQFKFIVDCFNEDINTRKAVIQIGDPLKDCFDKTGKKKSTKDFPCTRTLHFIKDATAPKLNLIVHMRSNDLLWGTTGVNIFNFTFMQEYIARIVGLELGYYYHIADNFHFYEQYKEKVFAISKLNIKSEPLFIYPADKFSLSEFNERVTHLSEWEQELREGHKNKLIRFNDPFFDDWAAVLYRFHHKLSVPFVNPILNEIFGEKENGHG